MRNRSEYFKTRYARISPEEKAKRKLRSKSWKQRNKARYDATRRLWWSTNREIIKVARGLGITIKEARKQLEIDSQKLKEKLRKQTLHI